MCFRNIPEISGDFIVQGGFRGAPNARGFRDVSGVFHGFQETSRPFQEASGRSRNVSENGLNILKTLQDLLGSSLSFPKTPRKPHRNPSEKKKQVSTCLLEESFEHPKPALP